MSLTNQITPNSPQPYSNQQNFGQLIGEVSGYHSGAGTAAVASNIINNVVRDMYDRRRWYGTMTKGQFVTTGLYSTGTVTVTNGSATVTGSGTNWTASLNGTLITQQQFRLGFTAPIYNIVAFDPVGQTITLEMPWGNPTQTSSGYFITQYYFSVPNIKSIFSCKNLALMYRLVTNMSQAFIENVDPSRLVMLYTRLLATMPPDANGNYQIEMWPVNTTQQAFPWLGWIQPPNLVNDSDNLPAYLRADVVKAKSIADMLMYRPKVNPNYSESAAIAIAQQKLREYEMGIMSASQADEALWRQDSTWRWEQTPLIDLQTGFFPGGAMGAAMMPVSSAGEYGGEDW